MGLIKFEEEHEKVVAIAIAGLLGVSVVAIIIAFLSIRYNGLDNITNTAVLNATATTTTATANSATAAALITLAGTAVGGVAGFISHKYNGTNGDTNSSKSLVLKVPEVPDPKPNTLVNFSLYAINPNKDQLTYGMLPADMSDTKLDAKTGVFCWNTPKVKKISNYTITFIVTDKHENSDSKDVTFTITP